MEEELDFYRISQESLLKNGLKLLKRGNVKEAITCFQNYLHYNFNNSSCWQNLADAYYLRGSYNTAIKSYMKSIQLREDETIDFYAELRIAGIHQMVHDYESALYDYEEILKRNSDYIPALLGNKHKMNLSHFF